MNAAAVVARPPTSRTRRRGAIALALLVVWLFLRVVVRGLLIEPFTNPSGAMMPTVLPGDHFFISKAAYGPILPFGLGRVGSALPPKRGDVVVFEFPESRAEHFIQRVVGIPGDRVEMRHGRVFLNDKALPRCRVGATSYVEVGGVAGAPQVEGDLFVEFNDERPYLTFLAREGGSPTDAGPWTVASGEIFVLGDNRNRSRDSRVWWGGKGGGVPYDAIVGRATTIWKSTNAARAFTSIDTPTLPSGMKALQSQLDACLGANPPLDATL